MDLKNWFTKNKWIFLVLIYIGALTIQVVTKGWSTLLTSAGIGLIIALIATVFNYSRQAKRILRHIKYFLGYGMFKWEANSVFTIKKDAFPTLTSQEAILRKISKESLENNNISLNAESIQISYDRMRNLKIFLEQYVMYLDLSITDADYTDDEGNDLIYVNIKTKASLRYRDNNKAINGVLLDFYYFLERHYNPIDQKYSFSIQPENMPKDFLKKQFIQEYSAEEIDSFSIISKKTKSSVEKVNHKLLTLTTNRREDLNKSIKELILRLS
jgi:hypothetical protein